MSDVNDDSIYSSDGHTLLKVPDVETFRIREGVWSIDEYAFEGCSRLREVDVPYTVTFFDDEAKPLGLAISRELCRWR